MIFAAAAALVLSCGGATHYLDHGEQQIIAELNQLRADPAKYARKLENRRRYYHGTVLRLPKQVPLRTREGVAALDDAVRTLRRLQPLPPLTASRPLSLAARDHVRDIGPKGLVAHEGTDKSSPSTRLARYARKVSGVGEVISFGPDQAAMVVMELLIDDGVPNRGHRKILLDEQFRLAGTACGPHAVYRTMCVIDLADRVNEAR